MTATQIQPLTPTTITRTLLTITQGPSLLVEVIEEQDRAGMVVHHITRRSRHGGPTVLVAGYVLGLERATAIAHQVAS